MLKKYTLLILLWIIPHILGQQWTTPYFSEAGTANVKFEDGVGVTTQIISAYEELPVPFAIAVIEYTGTDHPQLDGYTFGSDNELEITYVKRDDGKFVVQVNKFQDYEKVSSKYYRFNTKIGTVTTSILIHIVNLIDTPPSIIYDGPCTIEELQAPDTITDCNFEVLVDDGFSYEGFGVSWTNTITSELLGEENKLFEFHLVTTDDKTIYYKLKLKQELHYEKKPFYNFRSYFKNSEGLSDSVLTIIELIDMPNMRPTWIKPFVIEIIDEKNFKSIEIEATDGDTGINAEIQFMIEFEDDVAEQYKDLIFLRPSPEPNKALIELPPDGLDRDTLEKEMFRFTIIAYKEFEGKPWTNPSSALIVLNDLNDNFPNISMLNELGEEITEILIYEETFLTLPFDKIIIHDRDLEKHATYSVRLEHEGDIEYSNPFNIVPGNGYQRSEFFKINIYQNEDKLDFEDEQWQSFEILLISQETDTVENFTDSKTITIKLINWNDELPIFKNTGEYSVDVPENIGADVSILQVLATDRDVGDTVTHSILGNLAELLDIDKDTGEITTKRIDTFDYEKQTQVILQVMAQDTLVVPGAPQETIHQVYAQVTINVIDVNDETPELKMPTTTPEIYENVPGGFLVTGEILATDPDTTAELQFIINWDESSATKSGQYVDEKLYRDCFVITENTEREKSNNRVWGELKVNPDFVLPKVKDVDYENFEVLYLAIEVIDLNQEIGSDTASAQLTIRLKDINDNPPSFVDDTLEIERSVLEAARTGTQIGTILAEDIDGPEHNKITYSIRPANDSIPADWIEIDSKGVLRVNANEEIDCDTPPRDYLEYIIQLYDEVHEVENNIQIYIIDTNNKFPQITENEDGIIYIPEKVTLSGHILVTVVATDNDRDEAYRTMLYQLDVQYDKARSYFKIDQQTGQLTVELASGVIFDYDLGDKSYDIPIEVYDSITNVANRNTTQVRVFLLDVNDHAPEFVGDYSPTIAENSELDSELDELCATDLDSEQNGEISFTLNSIDPFEGVAASPPTEELFKIKETKTNCMKLYVASSLKGFYGTWAVEITANDHGDVDDEYDYGQQKTPKTFYVEVTPYNYHNPEISYPTSNSIRLSDIQETSQILTDVNKDALRAFTAYDPDGGEYGEIEFRITPTTGQDITDVEFFKFEKVGGKTSHLQLSKEIGDKNVYFITCTAFDGGDKSSEPLDLKITFVNIYGDPYFKDPEDFAFFREKTVGLADTFTIPEGIDPINEGLEEEEFEPVYYFLDKSESATYFNLDPESRLLTLTKQLDRSANEKHILRIILSRTSEAAPSEPSSKSILTLNILVTYENSPSVDPVKPTIFYPFANTLRLLAGQMVNLNLLDVTSSVLRQFEAFGRNSDKSPSDIVFAISNVLGESEDAEYFQFSKVDKTLSNLQLAKEIDHPNPFNIRITALDSANQESEPIDLKITFVDMSGTPYFENQEDLVFIHENDVGLDESYVIPRAIEPRNEGLEEGFESLYYFIDTTYNVNDANKFKLDSVTGVLTLNEKLNRLVKDKHEIRIIVTRNQSGPTSNPPATSTLLLTIIVWDINDNPPIFESAVYGVGITTSDRTGKSLLQVKANDLDLNETITYRIVEDSYKSSGEGIDAVEVSSFRIESENNLGTIILNFVPRSTMVGHFEFQIEALDNNEIHSDQALVKIFIIADANRVTFVFVNSVNDIELSENAQFIKDLFKEQFGYDCNIDETEPATDDNGVIIENLTNVRVHFIRDNEAIPAEKILQAVSDVVFLTKLKSTLAQRQLILQEVPSSTVISEETNKAELLQTILIVLSVVLGILCAVLIIAFFIRTRNLRRQLKAMSTVDFGSTSSNLNRREAPTTNVFSVEGSNPVLNNNNLKPDVFDNISVRSDESDFGGIQNDPTFKHRKESMNPAVIDEIRRKSINPMVSGKVSSFDSNL